LSTVFSKTKSSTSKKKLEKKKTVASQTAKINKLTSQEEKNAKDINKN